MEAEFESTVADLEALEREIKNATGPAREAAEANGEALKNALEAFGQKVEATLTPNATAPLEGAVDATIEELENLDATLQAATTAEVGAIENAG